MPTETQVEGVEGKTRFSWTGDVMGTADLARIAARGRVLVLAFVGDSDVGKTSFLVTTYLHLLRGDSIADLRFAGSWTLGGWEALAANMRWLGTTPPGFPPHTPRGLARQPGLLHLALRDMNDVLIDVLLADAPGEWFERWAIDRGSSEAEGARWLEAHADAALVFLDSERLSDPDRRGGTRTKTLQLLSRVADTYAGRPWRGVWAKHDRFEGNAATSAVTEQLVRLSVHPPLTVVSANVDQTPIGVVEAVAWMIFESRRGVRATSATPNVDATGGLRIFRRGA